MLVAYELGKLKVGRFEDRRGTGASRPLAADTRSGFGVAPAVSRLRAREIRRGQVRPAHHGEGDPSKVLHPAEVGNSLGWRVGSSVTNDRGAPVAIIAATDPVQDPNGDLGIQWTLEGRTRLAMTLRANTSSNGRSASRLRQSPGPLAWSAGTTTVASTPTGSGQATALCLQRRRGACPPGSGAQDAMAQLGRSDGLRPRRVLLQPGLSRAGKVLPLPAGRQLSRRVRLHANPGRSRPRLCPRLWVWPRQADPLQHADRLGTAGRVGLASAQRGSSDVLAQVAR